MATVYNPWMAGSEEDVTMRGLLTPAYMDMQQGEMSDVEDEGSSSPEAEPGEEMPGQPEEDTGESEDSGMQDGMHEAMKMALQTINQQSNVINQLMAQLKGE